MSRELLECVVLEPDQDPDACVIWLHGLGASGHDFPPVVPMLGLDKKRMPRFVFPHAPARPVTINMGMVMPAWYDIYELNLKSPRQDEKGILESSQQLVDLIDFQIEAGISAERIVLAGFSQGGAIASHVALRYPKRLGGLIALSTYLVRGDSLETELSETNRDLEVFQGHGTFDPMVSFERGQNLAEKLAATGCDLDFRDYPMQHEVVPQEIQDIGAFLRSRFES